MSGQKFIPYGRQNITQSDIDAVTEVLQSDYLTQGPAIKAFEDAICEYTGAKYAVAVNSATSGLHIACMSLGIGEGDILWTSPITFVSSANCARFCGADVDFVDIDPETFNISIPALKEKLEEAKANNKLPKIVIPVHMCGSSCDVEAIKKLSNEYGFKIVEDSAHAIGAKYKNKPVGSCEYSDISSFSFHPVKIITTAEGGVLTTNDEGIYKHLLKLRTHGITREADQLENESHGGWYYEMQKLSYNYRMTDMQAALGLSQMNQLDDLVARRNDIAKQYISYFENTDIAFQRVPNDCYSSYHLFPIQVDVNHKRQIFDDLRAANIGVNLHYMPVYLQPYYARLGFEKGACSASEEYYGQAISIPLYPQMTDEDVKYIADTVIALVEKYKQEAA